MRGFARYVAHINPQTAVPRIGILPPLKRARPFIYCDAEINALLIAALALPPANGLRRPTLHRTVAHIRHCRAVVFDGPHLVTARLTSSFSANSASPE